VAEVIDDVHSLDPVSYIQGIGLQPEDCYGFLPVEHSDITPYFFLYRDRPEYRAARAQLPAATDAGMSTGPIQIDPAQQVELDMDRELPGGSDGYFGKQVQEAMKLAEAFGGQPVSDWKPPQGAVAPDPERLARLAKLRSAGALNDEEYARLVAEATAPVAAPPRGPAPTDIQDPDAPAPEPVELPVGGTIVSHRLYPGLRMRSSTRQLNHFVPRYRDQLSLRSEDVYGVIPRSTRISSGSDGGDNLEWDDYWIVYRDRPEYEAGRAAWAQEMSKKGKWPDAALSPGTGEAPGISFDEGKIKSEKDLWPRQKLVMRKSGSELGNALRKKIGKWGYEPEQSFGFCPSFPNESIYFAWRKR
jgi:hypothetical protein